MKKKHVIVIKSADIKVRRPVASKPNTTMKSTRDYTRKKKHRSKNVE